MVLKAKRWGLFAIICLSVSPVEWLYNRTFQCFEKTIWFFKTIISCCNAEMEKISLNVAAGWSFLKVLQSINDARIWFVECVVLCLKSFLSILTKIRRSSRLKIILHHLKTSRNVVKDELPLSMILVISARLSRLRIMYIMWRHLTHRRDDVTARKHTKKRNWN